MQRGAGAEAAPTPRPHGDVVTAGAGRLHRACGSRARRLLPWAPLAGRWAAASLCLVGLVASGCGQRSELDASAAPAPNAAGTQVAEGGVPVPGRGGLADRGDDATGDEADADTDAAGSDADAAPDPSLRPVRMRIDALGVDAPIIQAGVTPEGEMELPGAVEVAWYRHGPAPGADAGSAVLAAHVDWNGEEGPFFDLRTLEPGTTFVVESVNGAQRHFRTTTEPAYVPKEELPVDDLFRTGGDPVVALVTCGGGFDEASRSYDDNVVVWAEPVPAARGTAS